MCLLVLFPYSLHSVSRSGKDLKVGDSCPVKYCSRVEECYSLLTTPRTKQRSTNQSSLPVTYPEVDIYRLAILHKEEEQVEEGGQVEALGQGEGEVRGCNSRFWHEVPVSPLTCL